MASARCLSRPNSIAGQRLPKMQKSAHAVGPAAETVDLHRSNPDRKQFASGHIGTNRKTTGNRNELFEHFDMEPVLTRSDVRWFNLSTSSIRQVIAIVQNANVIGGRGTGQFVDSSQLGRFPDIIAIEKGKPVTGCGANAGISCCGNTLIGCK